MITNVPRLVSIQVGLPRKIGKEAADSPEDSPWVSGIFKEPVRGPVWLARTNLAGDGQADLNLHGGLDKAVLAYAGSHYPVWREELRLNIQHGAFGENFTIDGLTEKDVCIGDIYTIGDAVIQVSQPRQPCWKLSRRFKLRDMTARVHASGRGGWYFRVIEEGYVEHGLPVVLREKPFPEWTVARAYEIRFNTGNNLDSAISLGKCTSLSRRWQTAILAKVESFK